MICITIGDEVALHTLEKKNYDIVVDQIHKNESLFYNGCHLVPFPMHAFTHFCRSI